MPKNILCYVIACCFFLSMAYAQETTTLENEILQAVNKERQQHNLGALVMNDILTKIAREHSNAMAKAGVLEHTLGASSLEVRADNNSYKFKMLAENIVTIDPSINTDIANVVVKMWMESPDHRQNILTAAFTEAGVGFSTASNGVKYYTMVYGAH